MITLKAKDVTAVIDKALGCFTSIKAKDQEWLITPLQLNFWRPPTNNDEGAKLNHKLKIWHYAGARATARTTTAVQDGNDVLITSEITIPAGESSATIRYRFTGNGQIAIDTEFRPSRDLPTIPRIGYQFEIPSRVMLWKIPAKVEGLWCSLAHPGRTLTLRQRYQEVTGELSDGTHKFAGKQDGVRLNAGVAANAELVDSVLIFAKAAALAGSWTRATGPCLTSSPRRTNPRGY